jgi:hypothetical protein
VGGVAAYSLVDHRGIGAVHFSDWSVASWQRATA